MSIRVDNTAQMFPGVVCWFCLVGVFLATGEWVSSLAQARHYPVLLALQGIVILVSAALFFRGAERRSVPAFLVALLITILSSGIFVMVVLGIARIRVVQFTLLQRSFGLGTALLTALPLLFLLYAVASPVLIMPSYMADVRRARQEKNDQIQMSRKVEDLREAVRAKPDNASAHLELARALLQKRKLDSSIRPNSPQGFMDQGYRTLLSSGLDAAIAELTEATRLSP